MGGGRKRRDHGVRCGGGTAAGGRAHGGTHPMQEV